MAYLLDGDKEDMLSKLWRSGKAHSQFQEESGYERSDPEYRERFNEWAADNLLEEL